MNLLLVNEVSLVGFLEHVGLEGVHGCWWCMEIYKLNRGGLEAMKAEVNQNLFNYPYIIGAITCLLETS